MDFQIVSPITLFPSLITQNWWVSRLSSLFGCVFNFRFYHSIFWFLSDELWKIKTHFKYFQVMDTELWWHFGKHTYLRNPQPVSSQIRFFFFPFTLGGLLLLPFFFFLSRWVVFFFFFPFTLGLVQSSSSFFFHGRSRLGFSILLLFFFFFFSFLFTLFFCFFFFFFSR